MVGFSAIALIFCFCGTSTIARAAEQSCRTVDVAHGEEHGDLEALLQGRRPRWKRRRRWSKRWYRRYSPYSASTTSSPIGPSTSTTSDTTSTSVSTTASTATSTTTTLLPPDAVAALITAMPAGFKFRNFGSQDDEFFSSRSSMFGIGARVSDPGTGCDTSNYQGRGLPENVLDDSLRCTVNDTVGIIREDDEAPFFGIVGTCPLESLDGFRAEWNFEVTGTTFSRVCLDVATWGTFATSGLESDYFNFTWYTDTTTTFDELPLMSFVGQEGLSQTYTLEGGYNVTLDTPCVLDGTDGTVILNNEFQTICSGYNLTGRLLTLSLHAQSCSKQSILLFRNLRIS